MVLHQDIVVIMNQLVRILLAMCLVGGAALFLTERPSDVVVQTTLVDSGQLFIPVEAFDCSSPLVSLKRVLAGPSVIERQIKNKTELSVLSVAPT